MGKPRQRVPFYNRCQVMVERINTGVLLNIHFQYESLKNCGRGG